MNNFNWTSGETEEKVYLKRDSRISKQSNPPHNKHFPFIPPPLRCMRQFRPGNSAIEKIQIFGFMPPLKSNLWASPPTHTSLSHALLIRALN